jgi:hypothetical protein
MTLHHTKSDAYDAMIAHLEGSIKQLRADLESTPEGQWGRVQERKQAKMQALMSVLAVGHIKNSAK